MSTSLGSIAAFGVCALLLAPPPGALAQETGTPPVPVVEINGGYMFLRDTSVEENVPRAWHFSGAVNANQWFGVVGEITGAHKTFDAAPFGTNKVGLYTFMGGPRFFYKEGRFVPFAQVLAGAAHIRNKFVGDGSIGEFTNSDTRFAIQPGGGLTVFLAEHVGVRGAIDYRRVIFFEDGAEDISEFRVAAGFVFGWGAR
jgi:outer membrane protein with beta-barrel domain